MRLLCVDDAVYGALARRNLGSVAAVVVESRVGGGLRRPMLLADGLANYARLMIERGRPEALEELEK